MFAAIITLILFNFRHFFRCRLHAYMFTPASALYFIIDAIDMLLIRFI